MRRNFEELRSFLHAHYPALAEAKSIRGELYPPPPMAQAMATIGSYAQVGGLVSVFLGSFIFDRLGVPEPFFVPAMRRNPVATIVGLTVASSFCGSLSATGAFEVSIDGEVVFSRLAGEGQYPTGPQLLREFEKRGLRSVRST